MADQREKHPNRRGLVVGGGGALVSALIANPVDARAAAARPPSEAPVTEGQHFAPGAPAPQSIQDKLDKDGGNLTDDAARLAFAEGTGFADPSGRGSLLILHRRPEARTFARTLRQWSVVGGDQSIMHWIHPDLDEDIANQTNGVDLHDYLQAAFDNAPIGSNLYVPRGDYRTFSTLTMTRQMNLIGEEARFQGLFGANVTDNLLNIGIAEAVNGSGDVRRMVLRGVQFFFGSGGKTAVCVRANDIAHDGAAADAMANLNMQITGCAFDTLDRSTGYALEFSGYRNQAHTVERCYINNTVALNGCADAMKLNGNVIAGTKVGVLVNVTEGAFNTGISGGVIVARDGAIEIRNGSVVHIDDIQMEQVGVNRGAHACHILIAPQDYPSLRGSVTRCNFGAGTNLQRSIKMIGTTQGVREWEIDRNQFNIAGAGGAGADIELADAGVKWVRIGPGNVLRGLRGGVAIDGKGRVSANTLDPSDLFNITDNGEGTFGAWQKATFSNGWSGASFRYRKGFDDTVEFEGDLVAGTLAVGTLITTLAVGFRPKNNSYLLAASGGGTATLRIAPNGQITAINVHAGSVFMTGSSLRVQGRSKYDPGV